MTDLDDLMTPCLVADQDKIQANAARMTRRATEHGVGLRPHLKTAKSADVAWIALGDHPAKLTVATLNEARYFLAAGFADLLYAVCITPNKFSECARLVQQGAHLTLIIADTSVAAALVDFCADRPAGFFEVMIEIDCGEHRTGLSPRDPQLVKLARTLDAAAGIRFAGVMTHGGHAYGATTIQAVRDIAEQERLAVIEASSLIETAGIQVPVRSIGSTPTVIHAQTFEGINEIRPGVYLFGDLFQAQLDTCRIEDIAVSVLATVIGHDRPRNRLVVDAGALALSKDRSTADSPRDFGYGLVCDVDGALFAQNPIVIAVHQEHGEITAQSALPFPKMPVGSQVRILPNHVCMTVAPYPAYAVVAGSRTVLTRWSKTSGW